MHSHKNVVDDDSNSRKVTESGNGHNRRHRRGEECLHMTPHTRVRRMRVRCMLGVEWELTMHVVSDVLNMVVMPRLRAYAIRACSALTYCGVYAHCCVSLLQSMSGNGS